MAQNKYDAGRFPYDEKNARDYNDRWVYSDVWGPDSKNTIQTLRTLLNKDMKWLDAGCGTGYNLSCFPEIERLGFDLSESMLREAKKVNTENATLRQGDLRDRVTEWEGKWDLVSCIGQPWTYHQNLDEIYKTVSNLASYTAKDGKFLLTFFDITDFTHNGLPQYYDESEIPRNMHIVNGLLWSFYDDDVIHRNMILPSMDQWIRWFSDFFMHIEIIRWPHDPSFLLIPRRNFICSIKREPGDTTPTKITEHPIPPVERKGKKIQHQSKLLLSIAGKIKPWRREFWRSVIHRVAGLLLKI